ncbi:MAG: hypothetical protein IT457_12625 [Planctomycetes bacterium]|nr:hypothetical protein [Planctomycetota bacterium]
MRAVAAVVLAVATLVLFAAFQRTLPRSPILDDGRIGTVLDRHGLAFVQPNGRSRWTPLATRAPLLAGDSVRTDGRGANAIEIELGGGGRLLIGPDARVELGARRVHLLRGDCEIEPGTTPVTVSGPRGAERAIAARTVLRATTDELQTLGAEPRWLSGYRSSTTSEWMGSLVAKIDGRDVPLVIRDHEVAVTIKDGVAETTIEQTYANGTNSELEGVFTFPLPPSASVSGFAMWVGSELVEADIVERTRARAIYEDLKRRKIDPGLLEWSGGNLFTARVWPIPRGGEKRIRIRYTQLLPLEGSAYTWSTALRSEALRQQPVRSVRVRAEIASTRDLLKVASTTHEVTAKAGTHSATLEWDARDFTPDRDFELRIETAAPEPLSIVDHLRDGEGYFIARVVPPGPDGTWQRGWQRTALPDGKALDVIVVCDTSGSMHAAARKTQSEVVAALLGTLGESDRFRLLATDWQAQWFDQARLPAEEARIAAALEFLQKRPSLGWTDLDLALRTALENAEPGAMIVYVGDGLVTRGDADGRAFARRAEGMLRGRDVTLHAVAVSNTIDATALDAITLAGRGSHVAAGDDPALAVASLLNDALAPRLTDARIALDGIEVARVYPAALPNVPVGRERIVVGRYRNTGALQKGTLRIEGTLAGRPVKWTRECALGAGDPLHSYVPRLWAVRHIDALLDEGNSPQARADVVAHSAEFQVMTPLTSLLVLETDADRERYGVTRRVKIRDGEAFFASASDAARADRLREAMQDAARWRVAMRQAALREIAGLGRDEAQVAVAFAEQWDFRGGFARAYGGRGVSRGRPASGDLGFMQRGEERYLLREEAKAMAPEASAALRDDDGGERLAAAESPHDELADLEVAEAENAIDALDDVSTLTARRKLGRMQKTAYAEPEDAVPSFGPQRRLGSLGSLGFPGLGRADLTPPIPADPKSWPPELIALLRGLDRSEALRALDGVGFQSALVSHHPLTQRVIGEHRSTTLWSRTQWFARHGSANDSQPGAHWLVGARRGIAELGLRVGRERPAVEGEAARYAPQLPGHATLDLPRHWRHATLRVESRNEQQLVVVLANSGPGDHSTRLVIDLRRMLVVRSESRQGSRQIASMQVEETTTLAGLVLPSRVVHRDEADRITSVETLLAERLEPAAFATRIAAQRAELDDVILADAEDHDLSSAREAMHVGAASLTQALTVLADAIAHGRSEALLAFWPRVRPMLGDRPGTRWIELAVALHTRRGEDLLALVRSLADSLASVAPRDGAFFLTRHLRSSAWSQLGPHEHFDLHQRMRPALALEAGDPLALERSIQWRLEEAQYWGQIGDPYRAQERTKALAQEAPWHLQLQLIASRQFLDVGDIDGARRVLDAALARAGEWTAEERDQLFNQHVQNEWTWRDLAALQRSADRWLTTSPRTPTPWTMRWSALLFSGQGEVAEQEVQATLELSFDFAREPHVAARVQAAVAFLLGEGQGFQRRALLEADLPRLASFARKLIETKDGWSHAWRIVADDRFRRTEPGRAILAELSQRLRSEPHVLAMPFETLDSSLRLQDAKAFDDLSWPAIVASLEKRIAATDDTFQRGQLLARLLEACDARGDFERAHAALRTRLADERNAESVPAHALDLLRRLAKRPWSEAIEDELLAIALRTIDPQATPMQQLGNFTGVARELADALLEQRRQHALGPVAELEKLERAERRSRETTALAAARTAVTASLTELAPQAPAPLRACLEIEALGYAAELGADRGATRTRCLALLDGLKTAGDDPAPSLLRRRASLTLALLCVKRGAEAELVESILAALRERALASGSDAKLDAGVDWRGEIARLLVALDRGDALLAALGEWIAPSRLDSPWRALRAWTLASRGDFAGARGDLEHLAGAHELDANEWLTLATWRLLGGDERGWLAAHARRFATVDEWTLRNLVAREAQRIAAKAGEKLDPLVVEAARAMLAKTTNARWMLQSVRELWNATKDHRVLGTISSAVVGQTPERAYGALAALREFLTDVHEEAALDELAARLSATAGELSATDRRALTFATYLVRARAALVPNGKGEHRRAMLAALRTAVAELDRPLVPGERVAMARMLADLDALPGEEERALRRQLLETLRAGAAPASIEDLVVSQALAQALHSDGGRDAAIDVMLAVLARSERDAGGALPEQAHGQIETVLEWWKQSGRFAEAERRLIAWRDPQPTPLGRDRFEQRLDGLYIAALAGRGTTSLGSGAALFDAARARLARRIAVAPAGRQWLQPMINSFGTLHRTAQQAKVGDPVRSLTEFAATGLPAAIASSPIDAMDVLYAVADALDDTGAPAVALGLLVDHCLHPAAWYARTGQEPWARFDWRIAELRTRAGELGKLHGDLRALVLRELERDLTIQGNNANPMWRMDDRRYWSALRSDFIAVAGKVLELRPGDAAAVGYTANFLWHHQGERRPAVRALESLAKLDKLGTEQRRVLVDWLLELKEYAQAVPHAERLVGDEPLASRHHGQLVHALGGLGRLDDARRALADAARRFDEARLRDDAIDMGFAMAAEGAGLDAEAVAYMGLAVRARERKFPVGREPLLTQQLRMYARMLGKVNRHDEAVDAAATAFVRGSGSQQENRELMSELKNALGRQTDLAAWLARWDARVAQDGSDAPLIRKALAQVLDEDGDDAGAVVQYRLGIALSPNDAELHAGLVAALDALGRRDEALAAAFDALRVAPGSLELIEALAKRLDAGKRVDDAERAWSELVEHAPQEGEGHAALARQRERQGRLADAIEQWQQVTRVRADDAEGFLALAAAQLRAGQRDEARATIATVLARDWLAADEQVKRRAQELLR